MSLSKGAFSATMAGRSSIVLVLLMVAVVYSLKVDVQRATTRERFIGSGVDAPEQFINEPLPPEVTGGKQMQDGHKITTHAAGPNAHSTEKHSAGRKLSIHADKVRWAVRHCPVDASKPSPLVLSQAAGQCHSVASGSPDSKLWALKFHYSSCQNVSVVNTGNELRALGFKGFMESNGIKYELHHVDFKSPSDHVVDGKHFDLELQLVHTKQHGMPKRGNNVLVVSLLLDRCPCGGLAATTSKFFDGLRWEHQGASHNVGKGRELHFKHECADLNVFRPSLTGSYFSYEGVRNSPPCSDEVISWVVMTSKNGVYLETLAEIESVFNGGNNAVAQQPSNAQKVTCFQA